MDEYFNRKYRARITGVFARLDEAVGTDFVKRYNEWLSIMEAAQVNYRKEIPAGISDCVSYLVKKSDIEKWIATEDLYAERPDYRFYYKKEDLAEYNCGLAYYFTHKNEVISRIRKSEEFLNMDPADKYAPTKNPYENIHIPFSPELQTARMIVDAKLPVNTAMLRHKAIVYDKISVCVSIQTLGIEAIPVIDDRIFDEQQGKAELTEQIKLVESALKKIEIEQCRRRGIEWTDKKPEPKYWQ